jgi:hypothetical protein
MMKRKIEYPQSGVTNRDNVTVKQSNDATQNSSNINTLCGSTHQNVTQVGLDSINNLNVLVDDLRKSLGSYKRCDYQLVHISCTIEPGRYVSPLIETLREEIDAAWMVTVMEPRTGAEHVHGLGLLNSKQYVGLRDLLDTISAENGLSPAAQYFTVVRRWKNRDARAYEKDIYRIVKYALGVGSKASKRSREQPISVTAWGAMKGAERLSQWAIEPLPELPLSRSIALCSCGCGRAARPGSKYANPTHGARLRQRRRREKHNKRSDQ